MVFKFKNILCTSIACIYSLNTRGNAYISEKYKITNNYKKKNHKLLIF